MGRSITPPYRVEIEYTDGRNSRTTWNLRSNNARVPADGKPTATNLARYVESFHASTAPDGANKHLAGLKIETARIVRQATGETMATWHAPQEDPYPECATCGSRNSNTGCWTCTVPEYDDGTLTA